MKTKDELFKEAILNDDMNAIKTLLPDITDINAKTELNETALMRAACEGDVDLVNALLIAGANIEIGGMDGMTAIWYAVGGNKIDNVKILLASGANINSPNVDGLTVIEELEREHGRVPLPDRDYTELFYILKNFGTFQYRLKEVGFDENNLDAEDMEVYTSCRDPITLEIMNDPISVSSGITYDRKSLRDWFESKKDLVTQEIPATIPCPITKLPIQRSELNNNSHAITKGMINRFVLKQETEFRRHLPTDVSPHSARASDLGLFSQSQHAEPSAGEPSLAPAAKK